MHTLHLDVEDPEDLQVLLLRVTPPLLPPPSRVPQLLCAVLDPYH